MSVFKAKMHQSRFRLGLCPRPRWGAYSTPPDPLAVFKGPTSKGREGGGKGKGKGKGRGGKGEGEGLQPPMRNPGYATVDDIVLIGLILNTTKILSFYYLRHGSYVLSGVCLSVCLFLGLSVFLLVTSRKNYRSDLHKNFTRD